MLRVEYKKRWWFLLLPFLCLTVLGSVYFKSDLRLTHEDVVYNVPTLTELLSMSKEELEKQDLAVINLVCAESLYGADNLDLEACLRQLDEWAREALEVTKARERVYHQTPRQWDHSINRWKCDILAQYLSRIVGLTYNPALKNKGPKHAYDTSFFKDSRDFLIHGLIQEKNRGTCASMPVLFTVIAQRMGYPVKLVTTHTHLFCRWADSENGETFNVEVTDTIPAFKSDEFYESWPRKLNPGEKERYGYLEPLPAQRELSAFMHLRGMCLWDQGRLEEAKDAFAKSIELDAKHRDSNFLGRIWKEILHRHQVDSARNNFLSIEEQKAYLSKLEKEGEPYEK